MATGPYGDDPYDAGAQYRDSATPPPAGVAFRMPSARNEVAIVGVLCGAIGIASSSMPLLAAIFGVLAIAFAGIGLSRAREGLAGNRGLAVAGLAIGAIAVAKPVYLVVLAAIFAAQLLYAFVSVL